MGFKARLILFFLRLRCAAAANTSAAVISEGAKSTEPKSPEIHCAMLGNGAPLCRKDTVKFALQVRFVQQLAAPYM